MSAKGYYRFPTLFQENVVFVSEDDLWTTSLAGGVAQRITTGPGTAGRPTFSPDGKFIAYASTEEGHREVFLIPFPGGMAKRLTFFGKISFPHCWQDEKTLIFLSNHCQAFDRVLELFSLNIDSGKIQKIPYGPASTISFSPNGKGSVIGRKALDPSRWKRYRGGTTGDLMIDRQGKGQFKNLVDLRGNLVNPMWIDDRIYFLSDHEGYGNIYSCKTTGKDIKRHTHHDGFYCRFPSTDGGKIIYNFGGDIYFLDVQKNETQPVPISYHSPKVQRNRRFVPIGKNLEGIDLHPQNHLVAACSRGKVVSMGNWNGPKFQYGERQGARYRLPNWLNDGKRIISISDEEGEETICMHYLENERPSELIPDLPIGRVFDMKVNPKNDLVAMANFQRDLLVFDIKRGKVTKVATSNCSLIHGFDWSPDGRYIAFSSGLSRQTSIIKIYDLKTRKTHDVTDLVLRDVSPVFDPSGKYLYFISYREFDPVFDNLQFELSFPKGVKPYLVVLRKDLPPPFQPFPKPDEVKTNGKGKKPEKSIPPPFSIDFDGIRDRIFAFPVPDERYQRIEAMENKVFFSSCPVQGSLKGNNWTAVEPSSKNRIDVFDFDSLKTDVVINGVTDFTLSRNRKLLVYRSGNRFRIIKAGEKSDENLAKEPPGKKSGWINLNRSQIEIDPLSEWKQMFREAWRLQRDFFWTPDLSKVDWGEVYNRYYPLLERVSTRSELSDLIWEMQGELGTSHCYEIGGDYPFSPSFSQGFLGADFEWNPKIRKWYFSRIVRGDPWLPEATSPLLNPGVNGKVGETILRINGEELSESFTPQEALINCSKQEILLRLGDRQGRRPRKATVQALSSETQARYRDWVEANKNYVHDFSEGKIGYLHIPNMGPIGYAEFHRYFLAEVNRDGLIVDVRFNGGGFVSQLILEKLARKRIAYVQSRHYGASPYPSNSVLGPIVALTNEYAGSDGDIFSHCFKLMKLGPLVGKRTWGGVVGISANHNMVDGTLVTQPEYSFWFEDVGYNVENYGTDPDIEVDILPQDFAAGKDPQLEKTMQVALDLLREQKPKEPDLEKGRPNLKPPYALT